MKRNWYATGVFLWRVTLDRGEAINYKSPVVYVVAESPTAAAAEAIEVMREAWKEEARWLKVLGVQIEKPVHGIAQ